jgi:ribosome biogenesis GTPase
LGADRQRTAAVDDHGGGKHTTTHRELFELPTGGGCIIDTPGLRELQLWEADDGLAFTFDDIHTLAAHCRFRDCTHVTEPDCAVRAAVTENRLDAARVEHWHQLTKELAFLGRRQDALLAREARDQDRAAGRALRARLREKGRG